MGMLNTSSLLGSFLWNGMATFRRKCKLFVMVVLIVIFVMLFVLKQEINNDVELKQGTRDYVLLDELIKPFNSVNAVRVRAQMKQHRHSVNFFNISAKFINAKFKDFVYLKTPRGQTPIFIHNLTVDKMISSFVKDFGIWEEDLLNQTAYLLSCNDDVLFIDIGCNIGVYTLFAAKLGYNVISVDPVEENLKLLSMSVRNGKLQDKVVLIFNALSDKYSNVTVRIPDGNVGGAYIISNDEDLGNENTKIETILLDDLIPFVKQKAVFLKMDVEGHELNILCGSHEFFQTHNVVGILMEWVHHRSHDSGQLIIDFLLNNGLLPYKESDKKTFLEPDKYYTWPENVFWIKR